MRLETSESECEINKYIYPFSRKGNFNWSYSHDVYNSKGIPYHM